MKSIVLLSILVIVLWGIWAFMFKLGVNEIGIKSALIWNNIMTLVISIVVIAILIPSEGLKLDRGAIFIILATIFGFLGTIIWYFGLEKHKAGLIVSFTALYPLITVIPFKCHWNCSCPCCWNTSFPLNFYNEFI